MALLEIPTRTDLPAYEQQVKLDGVNYIIELYFNPRINDGAGAWQIVLANQNRTMLIGPVPVIVNWPLFDRFVDLTPPAGTIFAYDTSGQNSNPGQFDLGNRVRLLYLEEGTVL